MTDSAYCASLGLTLRLTGAFKVKASRLRGSYVQRPPNPPQNW